MDLRLIGPVYELCGLHVQDVDAGCGSCGKRLCVVIEDSTGQWNRDDIICIDEGIKASLRPFEVKPSWRVPGKRVGICLLCRYTTTPADGEQAARWALQHLQQSHPEVAA